MSSGIRRVSHEPPSLRPVSPHSPVSPKFRSDQSGENRRGSANASSPTKRRPTTVSGEVAGVKVVVRVRPFVPRELHLHEIAVQEGRAEYLRSIVEMPSSSPGMVKVLDHDRDWLEKERFQYDSAIWSIPTDQQESDGKIYTQKDVFEEIGIDVLENTWSGYNNCIFAYGQTGSGKTHTMMGGDNGDDPGIIPRICTGLFDVINEKRDSEEAKHFELSSRVEVRFMEIYNEHVKDLLWHLNTQQEIDAIKEQNHGQLPDASNLKVRQHPITGPYVQYLTSRVCTSMEECMNLIELGNSERSVASTKMNQRSSRSHAIFRVSFTHTTKSIPKTKFEKPVINEKVASINLVDLAGSERVKKSQSSGQQLVEAASINQSLTTLKMVIDALVECSKNPKNRNRPIPFRDATLTWLLSDSLGGNSKTVMCCNVSPHPDNAEETVNTLRYGSKAREIINIVHVNEDTEARKIQQLQLEMLALQKQMAEATPDSAEHTSLRSKLVQNENTMTELQEDLIKKEKQAQRLALDLETEKETRMKSSFHHAFQLCVNQRVQAALRADKIALQKELDQVTAELGRAKETISDMKSTLFDKKGAMQNLQQENTDLKVELARATASGGALKKNLEELESNLDRERHSRVSQSQSASKQKSEYEEERTRLIANHQQSLGAVIKESQAQYQQLVQETRQREKEMNTELQEASARILDQQVENEKKVAEVQAEKAAAEIMIEELERANSSLKDDLHRVKNALEVEISKAGDEWRTKYHRREADLLNEMETIRGVAEVKYSKQRSEMEEAIHHLKMQNAQELDREKKLKDHQMKKERAEFDLKFESKNAEWKMRLETKIALNDEMHTFLKDVEVREAKYSTLANRVSAAIAQVSPSGSPDYLQLLNLLKSFSKEYTSYAPAKSKLLSLLRSNNDFKMDPTPQVGEDDAFFPLKDGSKPADIYTSPTRRLRQRGKSPGSSKRK
eukprot:TRINITY_DN16840_c0_g1_i1.p1 TRINITY_DN16840_c0_g1~~TRINITY_DN16840_c0_g1_i1.p1  ORF type:complete len:978 (+),score=241.68 TRINITY_DN16840_c0_g1_i1:45-2936(+)